jgi:hypothetical protein
VVSMIADALDKAVERREMGLEAMVPKKPSRHASDEILKPVSPLHALRCQTRVYIPEPENSVETPAVIDVKKAVDDYNSVDYQIIAMNLWRNTAKEL